MKSFGLGRTLETDITGLRPGRIPDVAFYDKWYGHHRWAFSTIRSISIGQGEVTITPLQMANVAAIIANLDVVCSVGTAVAQISGAVGARTLLCADSYNWTSFGTEGYPFQPSIQLVVGEEKGSMKSAVDKAIENI